MGVLGKTDSLEGILKGILLPPTLTSFLPSQPNRARGDLGGSGARVGTCRFCIFFFFGDVERGVARAQHGGLGEATTPSAGRGWG